MTQVVRQKWVLGLAGMNALLVLGVLGVMGFSLQHTQALVRDEATARAESLRAEVEGLRAELRSSQRPPAQDPQLAQTLQAMQLLATEQQTLLLRSLQPAPAAPAQVATAPVDVAPVALADASAAKKTKARRSSGRRSPRAVRKGCEVH